jgi:hypothetical protein
MSYNWKRDFIFPKHIDETGFTQPDLTRYKWKQVSPSLTSQGTNGRGTSPALNWRTGFTQPDLTRYKWKQVSPSLTSQGTNGRGTSPTLNWCLSLVLPR